MNIIEVESLTKVFMNESGLRNVVLKDIKLKIKKGECFVIIGPNGSGKTTLLRILALLEKPSSGSIKFNGKDITHLSDQKKVLQRREMSFVRQKPVVLNTTVYNNIAYGLKIRDLDKNEIEREVNKMIKMTKLEGFEENSARSLSGGEAQRVVIAMNFILNSELYLLDEVFANLDPENTDLLMEFINSMKQDGEKTIIMSTHDPEEAIKLADRIAVLIDGKISQIGHPQEIFTSPKDAFTARFIGYENIYSGWAQLDPNSGLTQIIINELTILSSEKVEGNVKVCIRPESIGISKDPPKDTSIRNSFKGEIIEFRDYGAISHVIIDCKGENFLSTITNISKNKMNLHSGSKIFLNFKATDIKCL